jgi:hypothetical protein
MEASASLGSFLNLWLEIYIQSMYSDPKSKRRQFTKHEFRNDVGLINAFTK